MSLPPCPQSIRWEGSILRHLPASHMKGPRPGLHPMGEMMREPQLHEAEQMQGDHPGSGREAFASLSAENRKGLGHEREPQSEK